MKFDANSPIPLYYQLREQIRNNILTGVWKDGQEIPSENQLSQTYHLSRMTIKQALDGLVFDGLIIRKQGAGTFVHYKRISHNLLQEPSFKIETETRGFQSFSKVVESAHVLDNKRALKQLEIEGTRPICYIKRVRYVNDEPMIVECNYISPSFEQNILQQDLTDLAIYKFIEEKNGILLNSYKMNIKAQRLTAEEQHFFCASDAECGLLTMSTSYADRVPVMYNERLYRAEQCHLMLCYDLKNAKTELTDLCWDNIQD